ncbi:MAG: hypothetical protein ACFHX7_15850 [Pseudomonadota bacterium]
MSATRIEQIAPPTQLEKATDLDGMDCYAIHNVDAMADFFMSLASASDHWLFVSSNGGLTAGRVSPDTALFPYVTVDKIHDSTLHTGSRTLIRTTDSRGVCLWEPFNREQYGRHTIARNLYKSLAGTRISFEELNYDLGLTFRYSWDCSDRYGFVRSAQLINWGNRKHNLEILDGLQNLLPAGTPAHSQANTSNLVDAYKWNELDVDTGLALYTLYSNITDRAEPSESLRANTVFCLGAGQARVLLSARQLEIFRKGFALETEQHQRGLRGAYLLNMQVVLAPGAAHRWQIVADVEKTQVDVSRIKHDLADPAALSEAIHLDIKKGHDQLDRIIARADGFQSTNESTVQVHHQANILFNVMRGGIFSDQYRVKRQDFIQSVRHFNEPVFEANRTFLECLPATLDLGRLLEGVRLNGDLQLERLCYEFLPITFGRRHGDPSRPWNHFTLRLKDAAGAPLLAYQGNWRDIFQNWEALLLSYPDFIGNTIAKFVNASTVDGYNPYRITHLGIDWETEDPDDPWSYIGYWGDHQIIYLLKLLELSEKFHPSRLQELLARPVYSYANVPYRIKVFADLLVDPKNTVTYDEAAATLIESRVNAMGADGKLVLDRDGQVYLVTLLEKLLVPLLAKVSNLVLEGGIWLNTQRPEWNDANNAIVGNGLSMVTLYYLRRYVIFLKRLITTPQATVTLSAEVGQWLDDTAGVLAETQATLAKGKTSPELRLAVLRQLGEAASSYREQVYNAGYSGKVQRPASDILALLTSSLMVIDHSIAANQRDDHLYHAYNLLQLDGERLEVAHLYTMLEGQVAVLSSGALAPADTISLLESLFASNLYRPDQKSFMLYPDRALPAFLEKNRLSRQQVEAIPLLAAMAARGDERLISQDLDQGFRFNSDFHNANDLRSALNNPGDMDPQLLETSREDILALYEQVFQHRAFTGRSGTMFGFEGLGCIYWHMVSKLLLAIQECYLAARDQQAEPEQIKALATYYYRTREGLGFNKSPEEYGAFPTDPYSHTPGHAGAQQPGMTGQVKEEVLTRFGELGIRIRAGQVEIDPGLLRKQEFLSQPAEFRYLDVSNAWQKVSLPPGSLGFTWCQTPVIYRLGEAPKSHLTLRWRNGKSSEGLPLKVDPATSEAIFSRDGTLDRIEVTISESCLFSDTPPDQAQTS